MQTSAVHNIRRLPRELALQPQHVAPPQAGAAAVLAGFHPVTIGADDPDAMPIQTDKHKVLMNVAEPFGFTWMSMNHEHTRHAPPSPAPSAPPDSAADTGAQSPRAIPPGCRIAPRRIHATSL